MINATPVTVKWLTAYSTEKLLFIINNSPILLRPPGKNLCKQPLTLSEIASFWNPLLLPLGITVALRGEGGGIWISSETTHFLLFTL